MRITALGLLALAGLAIILVAVLYRGNPGIGNGPTSHPA